MIKTRRLIMSYLDTIRNHSAAIAFAEAGEFEEAKGVAGVETASGKAGSRILQYINRMFVAAAFAEGGLHKEATEIVEQAGSRQDRAERPSFIELVGLQHAPVHVLVAS
jgi:hypothetical protein